jgi:spore coat protein H
MFKIIDLDNDFKHDVMDKYFNINNFLTWASVNTLMGNSDIKTSNFYILNPKNQDTFYFLPWDYDQTWGYDWEKNTISEGSVPSKTYRIPHNLWATTIGQRFLSQPNAIEQLKRAVKEIKDNYLTKTKINAFTESYYDVVFPLISQNPDFDFIDLNKSNDRLTLEEYTKLYDSLANSVERNYQIFLKDVESPMPFWLEEAVLKEENIVFDWGKSGDLQNNKVTYTLEVSTTPLFQKENIKYHIQDIEKNHLSVKWILPKGSYYYRVTAHNDKNPKENWQQSFDEFYDKNSSKRIFGVKKFTISKDGIVDNNNNTNKYSVGNSSIYYIIFLFLAFISIVFMERRRVNTR